MKKVLLSTTILVTSLALVSCGTLTGIPGHGGGKRYVEEQRLVSASIRGSLEAIDVSSLRDKRVALVFSLISDEGSGNMIGGRASLSAILSGGTMASPITTRSNALEIYQLAGAGTSTAISTSSGSGTTANNVVIENSNTSTSTQVTAADTVTTSTSSQTTPENSVETTIETPQTTSTTDASQTTSSTVTGGTTTTQTVDNPQTTVTNSGGTTTQTTINPEVTITSSSSTSTTNPDVTTTSSGTNSGTQDSTGSSTSESTQNQNGSTTSTRQSVHNTGHTERTKGKNHSVQAQLQYKGLGDYQVFSVPKSDASLLMSLTRNYLILNDIEVTSPQDPTADAIVYVTVDIFGTDRKRTDFILYNNERLSAETSIEMFAADRSGKIIMRPSVGNIRTDYKEEYLLWAGPFETKRETTEGLGMMNDFTDQ